MVFLLVLQIILSKPVKHCSDMLMTGLQLSKLCVNDNFEFPSLYGTYFEIGGYSTLSTHFKSLSMCFYGNGFI